MCVCGEEGGLILLSITYRPKTMGLWKEFSRDIPADSISHSELFDEFTQAVMLSLGDGILLPELCAAFQTSNPLLIYKISHLMSIFNYFDASTNVTYWYDARLLLEAYFTVGK